MSAEIVGFGMFEDKYSVGVQQVVLKNHVRYCFQLWEVVGRVGEDEMVLFFDGFQEAEDVGADAGQLSHIQFVGGFSDKFDAAEVLFYGGYLSGAAGGKLETDVSGSGKEV